MKQTAGKAFVDKLSFTPFLPNTMTCQKDARGRDGDGHKCVSSHGITLWERRGKPKGSQGGSESPWHQESLIRKNKEKAKPFAIPALKNTLGGHQAEESPTATWRARNITREPKTGPRPLHQGRPGIRG